MPERVFRLAGDGAPALALDELASLEAMERRFCCVAFLPEPTDPEHATENGGVLQQLLLLAVEHVEAGGDDALDGLRAARRRSCARRAGARTPRRTAGCRRPARAVSPGHRRGSRPAREARARAPRSPSPESGASESVSAFVLPPPQAGRRDSSSGRAVPTTSSGTRVAQSTRWSTKSRRPSSAQWRSSKTRTSGLWSAIPSRKPRHAANASS